MIFFFFILTKNCRITIKGLLLKINKNIVGVYTMHVSIAIVHTFVQEYIFKY